MPKQTKAQIVRDILSSRGNKSDEKVLEEVLKRTKLPKPLARVYIRENTERLAMQKEAAKKASKKKVAKKAPTKKEVSKKKTATK